MAYSLDLRISAVERYLNSEDSYVTVSETFGVSLSALKDWVKREREGKGLEKISQSGRPPKFSEEQKGTLRKLTEEHPSWTQEQYTAELNTLYPDLKCSRFNVCVTLQRMKITFKKKNGAQNKRRLKEFKSEP
ncbi:MAG: IS630 transposase-related protein [Myxococcota bacterium]